MARVPRTPPEETDLPDEVAHYLRGQDVEVVETDLPEYMVMTSGETDLAQWWGGKEREGTVYLVWYLPTDEERERHAQDILKVEPEALNAWGSGIWEIDGLGDYSTVYRTLRDAKADARKFVDSIQRGETTPEWPRQLAKDRAERRRLKRNVLA